MLFRRILYRLCRATLQYLAAILLTTLLMELIPGSPLTELHHLPERIVLQLETDLGLHAPLQDKMWKALHAALTLDFGHSLIYKEWGSAELILPAWALSAVVGTLALALGWMAGIYCAIWQVSHGHTESGSLPGWISTLLGLPAFLMAQVGVLCGWIPPLGSYATQGLLAACFLAIGPFAHTLFQLRHLLEAELNQPYARFALLQGTPLHTVVSRDTLRPALAKLSAYLAHHAVSILTGATVLERMLGLPGLGQWFVEGVAKRDAPVVLACTAAYVATILLLLTAAEILGDHLDPRRVSFKRWSPPWLPLQSGMQHLRAKEIFRASKT